MNNQSNLALSSSMAWTYLKFGLHEKRPLKDLTFPKGVISGGDLLSKDARMTYDNLFRDFDFGPPIIPTIHTVAGLGDIQSHDTQPVSVQTDQTQILEKDAVAPWSNLQLAKQNKVGWNPCFFWAYIGHILINETHHPLVSDKGTLLQRYVLPPSKSWVEDPVDFWRMGLCHSEGPKRPVIFFGPSKFLDMQSF